MTFPTAEEATKVAIPVAAQLKDRLRSVVNEHLASQAYLIEHAASQGRFSVEINPPSQEIINTLKDLGCSEFDFHFCLREVVFNLGYRASTPVQVLSQPSKLSWYPKDNE